MLEDQTGNPLVDLLDRNMPLGNLSTTVVISLLNLILAVLASLGFVLMVAVAIRRRLSKAGRAVLASALIAAALGAVSAVAWVLLDGVSKPTAWLDAYTPAIAPLFICFAVASIIHAVLGSRAQSKGTQHSMVREAAAGSGL
ncbi:MAG: hypothetical protein LBJ48_02535 [Coriobacteriales bacterium]|jgi:hypothetical protein|nr:hypothetical protein [Coriobacteriales bacterium]